MNKNLIIALNAIETKHDVELATAQEVDAESKRMTALYGQLSKAISDYNDKAKMVTTLSQEIAMKSQASFKVFDDFEKKVKEVGLDLPTDFIIKKQSVENLLKMADKLRLKPLTLSSSPGSY